MAQRINIQTMQQSQDTARLYKWDITIALSFISGSGTSEVLFNGRCSSVDVPNPTWNIADVNIRGFTKKESGAIDWNPITLTIYEVQSWTQLIALYELGNKQFNVRTGEQQNKWDYSTQNGTIQIDLNNLQDGVEQTWKLHGCVLETFTPPQMTSDKAGIVEMPFTCHYDFAELG